MDKVEFKIEEEKDNPNYIRGEAVVEGKSVPISLAAYMVEIRDRESCIAWREAHLGIINRALEAEERQAAAMERIAASLEKPVVFKEG